MWLGQNIYNIILVPVIFLVLCGCIKTSDEYQEI